MIEDHFDDVARFEHRAEWVAGRHRPLAQELDLARPAAEERDDLAGLAAAGALEYDAFVFLYHRRTSRPEVRQVVSRKTHINEQTNDVAEHGYERPGRDGGVEF